MPGGYGIKNPSIARHRFVRNLIDRLEAGGFTPGSPAMDRGKCPTCKRTFPDELAAVNHSIIEHGDRAAGKYYRLVMANPNGSGSLITCWQINNYSKRYRR